MNDYHKLESEVSDNRMFLKRLNDYIESTIKNILDLLLLKDVLY